MIFLAAVCSKTPPVQGVGDRLLLQAFLITVLVASEKAVATAHSQT